ncbi:CBS domain-containing protein [Methylocaldum marinum]|uniref:CBS domain-containing protein n=1 Tax=Methylocaldum marinum TaxID=1432792 RepID=A0A250KYS8_9GAMM|nr:CBS domain-containing protein [Methylocaldum marinum]BBA36742.1 CBS domain-containing protein [Methylocaldum marinum]
MNKLVRDVMTRGAECIGEHETILEAAKRMELLDIGALPICGDDKRLMGMLTDRDIVVKVLAADKDPSTTTAGDLAQGAPVMVHAGDSIDQAIRKMIEHKIRRLPVIEEHKLVGMVSQGDLATSVDAAKVGELVRAVSAAL